MPGLDQLRPQIARSWERAAASGLTPEAEVRTQISEDVDVLSPLGRAAAPVLEDITQQLADTNCSLMLANRDQRITMRRCGSPIVSRALDDVLAVHGAAFGQENSGTNALATVFEAGEPVFVIDDEHFLHRLHRFRCYGHPIVHPITRKLEGVIDITGFSGESTGPMRALAVSAVRAIEARLMLESPASGQVPGGGVAVGGPSAVGCG